MAIELSPSEDESPVATRSDYSATVLITSKDRKEVLCQAIDSVLKQTTPVELLVVDDGSSDGTSELVREKYPTAKLVRNEKALGIIAARNAAAAIATGDILFTLDDDAAFRTEDLVESVLCDFAHPRVGVVAIPYTNYLPDGEVQPPTPVEGRQLEDFPCSFTYPGGSNAKRRQLFLNLGGYSGVGRQAEEPTYAVKALDRGYVVRVSSQAEIDHYPQRGESDWRSIMYWGARNSVKFAFDFVPLVNLPVHLAGQTVNRLRAAIKKGRVGSAVWGIATGIGDSLLKLGDRQPIARSTYKVMRQLSQKPLPLSQFESKLPPLPADNVKTEH